MKLKFDNKFMESMVKTILFACAFVIVIQLIPKHIHNFKNAEIGKRWPNELIVSPFTMEIQKPDTLIEREKSEIVVFADESSFATIFDDSTKLLREDIINQQVAETFWIHEGDTIICHGEKVDWKAYCTLEAIHKKMEDANAYESIFTISNAGKIILALVLILSLALYFHIFRNDIFTEKKHIIFLLLTYSLMIAATALVEAKLPSATYVIPFALLPVIVTAFFDARTALFLHVITILTSAFIIANPFVFIVTQICAGMVAISALRDLTTRAQLAKAALFVFITYLISYFAICAYRSDSFASFNWWIVGCFACSSFCILFAYGLIYVIEKCFGYTSNVTLMEIANLNSPIMQDFSQNAPGSFQHAMQVANLADLAAKKVGANPLMVRAGALYHDIGKMKNPQLFTENQSNGINPLLEMERTEAAQLVIAHVNDGITIAKNHNLPKPIISFIRTHHGTRQTKYFLNSYLNEHPKENVDLNLFRYPYEPPTTKEECIVMLADSIEAASRSLKSIDRETISNLVNKICNSIIQEKQFENANISFAEINIIKNAFVDKLIAMYHVRISYPELKKEKDQA